MKPGDVWSIAGFDPSGGAGILADSAILNTLGITNYCVTTALTAQNGVKVKLVESVNVEMIQTQILALKSLGWPSVIKVGLLPNADTVKCVAHCLQDFPGILIYDPIMISSSGQMLMDPETIYALKTHWLPKVTVLVPNIAEAMSLTGLNIDSAQTMLEGSKLLLKLGVKQIIVKGGHLSGNFAQDVWHNGNDTAWLTLPKLVSTSTHGTGCLFSSSLAAFLAHGYEILDAWVLAKMAVHQAIRAPNKVMNGVNFVKLNQWPSSAQDLPWLTDSAMAGQQRLTFLPCDKPIGFYPVVDSLAWIRNCVAWGVKSVQLRIKDKPSDYLDSVIQAVQWVKNGNIQFFINDDWELAIKYNAYGLHLGQEDLLTADLSAIRDAGCRLGVSTHSYTELARAHALQPSYIALGPIYPTTAKKMRFGPQGLTMLQKWREMVNCPLVAIGGITLQNAKDVLKCQVDGISVISALTQAQNPAFICSEFIEYCSHAK